MSDDRTAAPTIPPPDPAAVGQTTTDDRRDRMEELREAGDPDVDREADRLREVAKRREAETDRDRRAQITDPNGVQCARDECGETYGAADAMNEILNPCRKCRQHTLLPVLISQCRWSKEKREKMRGCPALDHYGDKIESGKHVLAVQP